MPPLCQAAGTRTRLPRTFKQVFAGRPRTRQRKDLLLHQRQAPAKLRMVMTNSAKRDGEAFCGNRCRHGQNTIQKFHGRTHNTWRRRDTTSRQRLPQRPPPSPNMHGPAVGSTGTDVWFDSRQYSRTCSFACTALEPRAVLTATVRLLSAWLPPPGTTPYALQILRFLQRWSYAPLCRLQLLLRRACSRTPALAELPRAHNATRRNSGIF